MSDQQTTLFHGGAYEITAAREPQAGIVVEVFDMEEDASSVAPMTPSEWDAFVAAGNAALGRPSTPLEARLEAAIEAADEHAEKGWSLGVEAEDLAAAKGHAAGLRAALRMAREAGPTVPRAAVLAVVEEMEQWWSAHNALKGRYQEGKTHGILHCLDAVKALLGPAPTEGR